MYYCGGPTYQELRLAKPDWVDYTDLCRHECIFLGRVHNRTIVALFRASSKGLVPTRLHSEALVVVAQTTVALGCTTQDSHNLLKAVGTPLSSSRTTLSFSRIKL